MVNRKKNNNNKIIIINDNLNTRLAVIHTMYNECFSNYTYTHKYTFTYKFKYTYTNTHIICNNTYTT